MAAILTEFVFNSEKPHPMIQAFFLMSFSHLIILNDRVLLEIIFGLPGEMNACEHAPKSLGSFPKIMQGCTHSKLEC